MADVQIPFAYVLRNRRAVERHLRLIAPVRQAQGQGMMHRWRWIDDYLHLFLPRIVAADAQAQRLIAHRDLRAIADIQVDVQGIVVRRVDIVSQRGQHAGNIRRAARAAEPALADGLNVIVNMVEF